MSDCPPHCALAHNTSQVRLLQHLALEPDCLREDHVPELLGGQVVELHVEREGPLVHRLVRRVVVGLK